MRLDAVASIDPELLISRTLAGRSYVVFAFDRRVQLTLPSRGPATFGAPPESAIPMHTAFPAPPLAEGFGRGVAHGGVARAASPGVLVVNVVRLRWDERRSSHLTATPDVLNASKGFGSWLAIARDWLAPWTGTIRRPVHGEPMPRIRVAIVDDPDRGTFSGSAGGPRFVMGERAATALELRAAFAAASTAYALPAQHHLLAEALVDFHREEYRLAVVTACAAVEVALTSMAREALRSSGRRTSDIDEIMRGVSGVVDLYRLNAGRLTGVGVSIGRVNGQLAGPRNKAAHAGEALDEDTAKKAIRTARELLTVTPIQTPRQVLRACGQ
jgi:HEPN domain-containing protein